MWKHCIFSSLFIANLAYGQTYPTADQSLTFTPPSRLVPLHIESLGDTQRIRLGTILMGRLVEAREVCSTPCTVQVPPTSLWLESSAPGIETSSEQITVPLEGLSVRLHAPRVSQRRAGGPLIGLGSTFLSVGALTAIAGAIFYVSSRDTAQRFMMNQPSSPAIKENLGKADIGKSVMIGGIVAASAGLVMLIPGIIVLKLHPSGIAASAPLPTEPMKNPPPGAPEKAPVEKPPDRTFEAYNRIIPQPELTLRLLPTGANLALQF